MSNKKKSFPISSEDQFSLNLLYLQGLCQLIDSYSYVIAFTSSTQGVDYINKQYSNCSNYNPDPDKPALSAATIQFYIQIIFTWIVSIQHSQQNEAKKNNTLEAPYATVDEIYYGNLLLVVAYWYILIGVKKLYALDHQGPIYGV